MEQTSDVPEREFHRSWFVNWLWCPPAETATEISIFPAPMLCWLSTFLRNGIGARDQQMAADQIPSHQPKPQQVRFGSQNQKHNQIYGMGVTKQQYRFAMSLLMEIISYRWKIITLLHFFAVVFLIGIPKGFVAGVAEYINKVISWHKSFQTPSLEGKKSWFKCHRDKNVFFLGQRKNEWFKFVANLSLLPVHTETIF